MSTDPGTASDGMPNGRPAAVGPGPADLALHILLLQLAGYLPDRVMADAREALAASRRVEVVRMVALEVLSQPLQLDPDEIDLLRTELAKAGDGDLVAVLPELRGQRQPGPWLFVSALPAASDDTLVVRPLDLSGGSDELDAVDRAVLAEMVAVPGVTAVWRTWRLPPPAESWREPVRVVVVTVDDTIDGVLDAMPELPTRLCRAMAAAGDPAAQAEVCWTGLNAPLYQTLARSCGALLWAATPAVPVRIARAFDGVDPDRGPWFDTERPVVPDGNVRARLLDALNTAEVITRSDTRMLDVLDPERGDVVPLDLRADGRWVWSDAVAYFLEQHGLAPDPDLSEHLLAQDTPPLDEVGLHRALVHLLGDRSDDVVWRVPGAGAAPGEPGNRSGRETGEEVQ